MNISEYLNSEGGRKMNPHAVALYIKGWEYIIAIIFNLAFLVFWFLVTRQRAGGQEQSSK